MNLPNEENNLSLFRYIPEVTSQLLIQANETQLVPVPNICDELLLTDLEVGNTWTIGGLPVLLNGAFPTSDQQLTSNVESNIEFEPHKSPLPEILNDSPDQQIINDDVVAKENEESYSLEISSKNYLPEDCLFISDEPLEQPEFIDSNVHVSTDQQPISSKEIDEINVHEIQSSDITSQQAFIEINNTIVPQLSLLSSNKQEILINLPSQTLNTVPKPIRKKKDRKKKINLLSKQKHSKANVNSVDVKEVAAPEIADNSNNEVVLPNLIEILHLDGTTSLLNLDGTLFNNETHKEPLGIESCDNIVQAFQTELPVEEEPDSTVVSDNDNVNINDIAEVVMSYKCKHCDFACSDRDSILQHYRDIHTKQRDCPIIPENIMVQDNSDMINIICTNNNLSELLMSVQETEKKIMRIKRKPKKEVITNVNPVESVFPLIESNETMMVDDRNKNIGKINEVNDDEITIYLCSQCGNQFMSVEDCRNHMIEDHNMYPADESCDQINSSMIQLKKDELLKDSVEQDDEDTHMKNVKAIEKFTSEILKSRKIKCTVRGCPYRFAKLELLTRHESCHMEGVKGQFRCPECDVIQDSWRLCSLHLWQCHQMDIDLYTCPLCDYKGSTANKLKNHVKIHSEERHFVCTDCGRGFKQASQLRNHRVRHLNKDMQEVPRWYTQKHCDTCGKIFADSKCLKKHMQAVHSKLKPFICNVCGHTCSRKAMLQMHLRQHTGEKPYSCKLCYYKTGDHNSLRRHIMRHSGVRPYKCPHCNYTAIQSNSYKNHLASKHPGMSGSYSCTECPFKTVNDEAFTSHVNDHRNGRIITISDLQSKELENDGLNTGDILFSVPESRPNENTLYLTEKSMITIQGTRSKLKDMEMEDDETQNCFLSLSDLTDEQTVDTGGITIPAEPVDPINF